MLAVVVTVVVHLGELEQFGRLLRQIRPVWLAAAFTLQAATYFCAAGVWALALAQAGRPLPLAALVPSALAMLFANQAFPSAGISGSLVVVRALRRRGIPSPVVMGALILGLVTSYAALLVAVLVGVASLGTRHEANVPLLLVATAFALAAVGVPAAVLWFHDRLAPRARAALGRLPAVGTVLRALGDAPSELLRSPRLLARAIALQFTEIVLDAATLLLMLLAIQAHASPVAVFGSFALASAVSRVVPVPLGLGTFEGSLVALLRLAGVPIEEGLTATLLLRGLTLWMPMLPGLWCARRELWPAHHVKDAA